MEKPSLRDAMAEKTPQRSDATPSKRNDVSPSRRYNIDGDAKLFRTTLFVRRDAHERLRNIAHKQRRKVTDVIGEAIDEFLKRKGF